MIEASSIIVAKRDNERQGYYIFVAMAKLVSQLCQKMWPKSKQQERSIGGGAEKKKIWKEKCLYCLMNRFDNKVILFCRL